MKTIGRVVQITGLAALGLAFILLMVRDYTVVDLPASTPPGEAPYGHNTPEILSRTVIFTLVEMGLLYRILRPWSFEQSIGRAAIAIALFLPWLTLNMLISMHSGGVFIWHLLWLVAVNLVLMELLLGNGIASLFRLLASERA